MISRREKATGRWKCPPSNEGAPLRPCLSAQRPYWRIYGNCHLLNQFYGNDALCGKIYVKLIKGDIQVSGKLCPDPNRTNWYLNC